MRYLCTILAFCAALMAQERDINALIDDVVNATPETRYEKMNAFKMRMRELNQAQRTEALKTLRAKAYAGIGSDDMPKAAQGQSGGETATQQQQQLRMQQQQLLQQQEQQIQAPQQPRAR